MFLPYVFVPAGRSCFWLPNLIGLKLHPVNQPIPVGDHCVTLVSQFCHVARISLHAYGHRRAVEFHASLTTGDSRQASASLLALSRGIIQHWFHSINVIYSNVSFSSLVNWHSFVQMRRTKRSQVFRNWAFGVICYSLSRIAITSPFLNSWWCGVTSKYTYCYVFSFHA